MDTNIVNVDDTIVEEEPIVTMPPEVVERRVRARLYETNYALGILTAKSVLTESEKAEKAKLEETISYLQTFAAEKGIVLE